MNAEYKILKTEAFYDTQFIDKYLKGLEEIVREYIEEGWRPCGGVSSVGEVDNGQCVLQAMTRDKK